jgi:fumarylacetoacetate (FAA) hydrolase
MRLATVFDVEANEPRPVFELPGGQRVPLRELFRSEGADLDRVPVYFQDLSVAVQHLDDVLDAARYWAKHRFDQVEALTPDEQRAIPQRKSRFLPPVPQPRSFRDFYSFEQHVKTCRGRKGQEVPAAWYHAPAFYFSNPGALVGHETPVHAPAGCDELDFELELGLIIGRGGKDIEAKDAWKHVAGFTIINDFSARDLQRPEMSVGLGPAKAKDFATAVGPYLVTLDNLRDRIDDSGRLRLKMSARLNGKEISRGNAASMHFSWPQIIEHASRDAMLYPGDLIGSGTVGTGCILELGPETVGGWLKPGDVIELDIERLGVLRTPIVDRPNRKSATTEARELVGA